MKAYRCGFTFLDFRRNSFLSVSALALLALCRCWSQSTIYTDRTAFMDACQKLSGTQSAISFAPYLNGGNYVSPGSPFTVSNVTFSGNILLRQDPISIAGEVALNNYDMDRPLGVHFENGALAFGADFSSLLFPYNTSNFMATITVRGGDNLTFSATPGPGKTFFGFIESSPFSDLIFSDGGAFGVRQGTDGKPGGTYHEELNANVYVVQTVPEPALGELVSLGIGLFSLRRIICHDRHNETHEA